MWTLCNDEVSDVQTSDRKSFSAQAINPSFVSEIILFLSMKIASVSLLKDITPLSWSEILKIRNFYEVNDEFMRELISSPELYSCILSQLFNKDNLKPPVNDIIAVENSVCSSLKLEWTADLVKSISVLLGLVRCVNIQFILM